MYKFASAADTAIYESGLKSPVSILGIRLLVKYASGSVFTVPKKKIITPGVNLLSQAVNSNSFNLGSCCIDTLSVSTTLDAPGVKGSKVNSTQFILEAGYGTSEDNIKYVPLGYYRMQEKSCSKKNGKYDLKLQSFMAALDRNLPKKFDYGSKTVKEWLEWLCTKIKVRNVAGSDQDEYMHLSEDIDYTILQNQDFSYAITSDTGYETYRDMLKDLAVVSGAFATFDRGGGLILKPFRSGNTSDAIEARRILSLSEAMNTFSVEQIRCVTTETSESGEEQEVDYSQPADYSGSAYYDISGLKIFDTLADRTIMAGIAQRLYNVLGSTSYSPVPFETEVVTPDFRLDVGDWISVEDIDGTTKSAQIMKIEYSIPGRAKYSSYQNPSNTDQNATKRSSYTSPKPSTGGGGGGGTTVVVDQTAQWAFNS